jgi:DNA-binding NtrC family response regulator
MKKILVIDDDEDVLRELEEVLIGVGYDVISLNKSEHLEEIAQSEKIDIVLIDFQMDGTNNLEVIRHFRTCLKTKYIPLILISGYCVIPNHPDIIGSGLINNFIQKPFDVNELVRVIENALINKKTMLKY